MAAYLKHAAALGYRSGELDGFMQKALAAVLDDRLDADALTHLTLETGKYGVEAMALLDRANTETYGNPEITKVEIGVRPFGSISMVETSQSSVSASCKERGMGVAVISNSWALCSAGALFRRASR